MIIYRPHINRYYYLGFKRKMRAEIFESIYNKTPKTHKN